MAYDKTTFLSGLAMGLTGKGDPTFTASDVFSKGYLVGAKLRAKRVLPETAKYLTFASADSFTIGVNNATKNWDGALYYSTDADTWNEWDGTTAIGSAEHNGKQRVYMRGSNNSVIAGGDSDRWVLNGTRIRCKGNIETLLDYETVANGNHPEMASLCYGRMFRDCTSLTSAPELPATTLAHQCYRQMFDGCTSLTSAPALPATALVSGCYYFMFYGCTSLTSAPELPATTLANDCYRQMFCGCTSLTSAPELPATTLVSGCYSSMFRDCTGIKLSTTQDDEYQTPYRIPTTGNGTDYSGALNYMFFGTGGTIAATPTINTTYYMA